MLINKAMTILVLLFLISLASGQKEKKCCLTYDKTNSFCLTCPEGTYLSGNNCIVDIPNCQLYSECFNCAICSDGYKLVDTEVNGLKTKKC